MSANVRPDYQKLNTEARNPRTMEIDIYEFPESERFLRGTLRKKCRPSDRKKHPPKVKTVHCIRQYSLYTGKGMKDISIFSHTHSGTDKSHTGNYCADHI